MGVKIHDPLQRVLIELRKPGRCPGGHRRRAAHHQGYVRAQGDATFATARLGRSRQRAIEPSGLRCMRHRDTAFQHVLAIKMRALPIWARDGVKHRELTRSERFVQEGELRMQAEEIVEAQRAIGRARGCDGKSTAQARIGRIAIGGHGCQAVDRAAHDHDDQARIAARTGEGQPGRQQRATRDQCRTLEKLASCVHGHLRMNSGAASNSVRACAALAARVSASRVFSPRLSPSICWASCSAFTPAPQRWPIWSAQRSRCISAEAPSQSALRSGQPAGEFGDQTRCPRPANICGTVRASSIGRLSARQVEIA